MRSEIVSSCSATLLRSFSSLECFIHLSGTLAMKFWSRNTRKDFFLSGRYGEWSFGSVSTNVFCGRKRSFSTCKSACEIDPSSCLSILFIVSCHTRKEKMLKCLYPSALSQRLINLPLVLLLCPLMFLWLLKIPRALLYKGLIVPLIPRSVPVILKKFL